MLHEGTHPPSRMGRLAAPARSAATDPHAVALVVVALIFLYGAIRTLWPFVASFVLAVWAAHLCRPLFLRLREAMHGRGRAAGALTAILVVALITPVITAVMTLIPAAKSLFGQLRAASGGKGVLEALVSSDGHGGALEGQGVVSLVKEYGASASKALALIAGASIDVILGAFVFFIVFYELLTDGERWWGWLRSRSPLDPSRMDRLSHAFHQAGRGLIVGSGLTALLQGGLAAVLYAAFGVPRAMLLGMLSVVAALIPMTGPMLVWVPVCAGLALTGHVGKAVGLAALCAGVVGTVDNIIRPWLSRRFEVGMPVAVLLVAMLGGVVVLGGWGIFLGPLVVRLAAECLDMLRERRLVGRRPPRLA